jgi:F0F1-type ATP synthase membrane subunit a
VKKFISTIVGFVLIIAIFVFAFIITAKRFMTEENLSSIIKTVYESSESYTNDYFIQMINGTNENSNYNKYFDNQEIEELYITYFSRYVLYANGVPNVEKPEFNELKEKVDGYIEEYENSTGMEANRDSSFKFFYNLDDNMYKTAFVSNKVKKVVKFIFNKNIQDITIGIILLCIVVIIMLNRDITRILLHISSVFLSNGIGMVIIKFLIDNYSDKYITNRFILKLLDELSKSFTRLYIICFIVGALTLLAFLAIKASYKRKDKPELKQVTEESLPSYFGTQAQNQMQNQINSLDEFNNMGKKE